MQRAWPRPERRSGRRSSSQRSTSRCGRRAGATSPRARSWLLVREFRPPTRFSRAAADGTLALEQLERGAITPAAAAAAVRTDLLDTYDGRIRTALATAAEAEQLGFSASRADAATSLLGYWAIVGPVFREQRGVAAGEAATAEIRQLAALARSGRERRRRAIAPRECRLEGFRAAPLSDRRDPASRGPARPFRAPRLDRVRTRSQQRQGDEGLRDPGSDLVQGRRCGRVRGSRADPARA